MQKEIIIRRATENNLKSLDINIPRNKFVVVTGVSGSGKSSLIYDIIYKEAQRKYLQSFSSKARQLLGKLSRPKVEHISGLSPVISVDQYSTHSSPRSTVGTMSGLYDLLRLLFARIGNVPSDFPSKVERSLFSFNTPKGACPTCKGLGVEDKISIDLLIADENKTIREGALKISTPTGYIVYSQVTIDVLNMVCESEGYNVDIPWKDLTPEQKHIVLYGSDKIKIPYGKHTLESRMKWSGITAKPREEDYYKGIIPVMEVILKRDRNKNILRFVESVTCNSCSGKRLKPEALSVLFHGNSIIDFAEMNIVELQEYFKHIKFTQKEFSVGQEIKNNIIKKTSLLIDLGLGYLNLNRESTSLSGGEMQRIRLANQANSNLRGIIYVLDEPSVGLHPKDNDKLIAILKKLRDNGNTVIAIEHDEKTMLAADYLIDIGPDAGKNGGELVLNSKICNLPQLVGEIKNSKTLDYLSSKQESDLYKNKPNDIFDSIIITGANINNLKNITVEFKLGAFNVVTGVSGAGKSSLVKQLLGKHFKNKASGKNLPLDFISISGDEKIEKVIEIDQSPIGRTPRSNPATYTKLSDHIRDLFASLPETKNRNWKKGRFSFNVKGGRCEECEGAGYKQIGMHFLGNVDVLCPVCNGKRFNKETLEICYNGKNIYEVLEMQIDEALHFFEGKPKLVRILQTMYDLGLGYIALGQSSTTLSGGEAQRIKLASELAKNTRGNTLYILDEPTTGLHSADIKVLLNALNALSEKGHTIISIEHNADFILNANHIIDLGPESGTKGGNLVVSGNVKNVLDCKESYTAQALSESIEFDLNQFIKTKQKLDSKAIQTKLEEPIRFKSVSTNNLKDIDFDIPVNKITCITGVSGSGKSSLAFDTVFAEGQNLFIENFSAYIRKLIGQKRKTEFESATGLMPAIAISQKQVVNNPRSTVGTLTEISDYYRLLFSRTATHEQSKKANPPASAFSFNNQEGACEYCKGLGNNIVCNVEKLITNPDKSLIDGALSGTKTGKFYGDPFGQYIAILQQVGKELNIDFGKVWNELSNKARQIAMYGTDERKYQVNWKYNRKGRTGQHNFETIWQGFTGYVNEEYNRKHADSRGTAMLGLMKEVKCEYCCGSRYKDEILQWKYFYKNIAELSELTISESIDFFNIITEEENTGNNSSSKIKELFAISEPIINEVLERFRFIADLGLSYISINRSIASLSGGEAQRLRLAGMLASGLTGVLFVLDEPTVGLHSRDTKRLISQLQKLRDFGNTIIIVEHDEDMILAADNIIEMGPGAGNMGGKIIASGNPKEIQASNSLTGQYLSGNKKLIANNFSANISKHIELKGANANNLKNIDIDIPLNKLVAITGVSGSGKTSLVFEVLYPTIKEQRPINCSSVSGLEIAGKVVSIDSTMPSQSSASNVLTYTGLFDIIRDEFAKTKLAKEQKLAKRHFSFNQKGGRCEHCHGRGQIKIAMDFLQDVWVECEECKGERFVQDVLKCKYKSLSIYDVLQLTVKEAKEIFSENDKLYKGLNILIESGLGYIKMGQSTNTFSGGELQRLKLANELINSTNTKTIFLLDEPTTGLHFEDINSLLKIFYRLLSEGHSIIVVEHNKGIISNANHIIELGPESGDKGGEIVINPL